jgi:SAM-dependent methyltransferase
MNRTVAEQMLKSTLTDRSVLSGVSALCPLCGQNPSGPFLCAPDRFHQREILYRLVRCSGCHFVWLQNPPSPEVIGQHYGTLYDSAIAAAGDTSPDRWRDRRKTLKQYKEGGTILDLGCSSGSFLASLDKGTWDLHGIEMSIASAKKAQVTCGAKVFSGNILDAPYASETFDVITCFHVFEHLYRPREVLDKVAKWLKPGGIFYVLVPNIDSAAVNVFRSYWYGLELPRHLSHFSPESLSSVATAVGFETVSLTTHREMCLEYSMHYILDDLFHTVGLSRTSLAAAGPVSIPHKVVRKIYRWILQPVLTALLSFGGDGESIHAVFRRSE